MRIGLLVPENKVQALAKEKDEISAESLLNLNKNVLYSGLESMANLLKK